MISPTDLNIWHNQVFGEITTNYKGKQYELLMKARHGKTFLIKRLAKHFASIGKDVRVIGTKSDTRKPLTENTVLLVDEFMDYDPSNDVRNVGGTLIIARTPTDDEFPSFKIVRKMDIL
jgi:hypothetical protein